MKAIFILLALTYFSSCSTLIKNDDRNPAATATNCNVPQGKESPNLSACFASPNLKWALAPMQITAEQVLEGPSHHQNFTSNGEVYCYYRPHPKSQNSPKFRCFRTTDRNFKVSNTSPEFYNNKGVIVPAAVSVGAEGSTHDGLLLDSAGQPIADSKGGFEEGDELKIKYFNGGSMQGQHFQGDAYIKNSRESEVFTEVASSRAFWLLGIPVDQMYNVGKVNCFGCAADPFNQTKFQKNSTATFMDAAIELKLPGKRIADKWSWKSVASGYKNWSAQVKIDYEALLLASQLISYHNDLDQQNRFICEAGQMDKTTRECKSPIPMINDVGSTFGGKKKHIFAQNPRGELRAYTKLGGKVFASPTSCEVAYPLGDVKRVSAAGLEAFKQRLTNLNSEKIRNIFVAAKFGRIEPEVLKKNAQDENKVIDAWASEFEKRVQNILTTTCP